jgi:hypothetical protein
MFHWPLVTVNGVLVQAPWDCFGPRSTTRGPVAGAVVAVLPPAVEVCVPGADVAVEPAAVVAEEVPPAVPDSAGKGLDPPPAAADGEVELPLGKQLPRSIPTISVPAAATTSCQVLHDTRSLILSWPGVRASPEISDVDHPPPA